MIDIIINPTKTTPLVRMDAEQSIITFKGRSSPENSIDFYHPLISKVPKLFASTTKPIEVEMSFTYFNTSSSKCLFDFFKMLKKISQEGKEVVINWHYEEDDEDMLETGEDYADILDLDFNFVAVEEMDHINIA